MAELKLKVERSDTTEPMRLPIAERTSRLADQKARLVGVSIPLNWSPVTSWSIPCARCLWINSCLGFLGIGSPREPPRSWRLRKLTLTSPSIQMGLSNFRKSSQMVRVPSTEIFKSGKPCNAGLWPLIKRSFALTRRWRSTTMSSSRPCAESHLRTAFAFPWLRLTKGALSLRPDGSMPFEGHLASIKDSAHIQFFMIPQPRPGRFAPYTPPKGQGKGRGKGKKGKGEQAGKLDPSKPSIDIRAKEPVSGKPICFQFNRDGCRFAKAGKRCRRGLHICWRCFKGHPFSQCTMGGA